jgi:hypothetical protein
MTTTGNGEFLLTGLDCTREYELTAARSGSVCVAPKRGVTTGESVELELVATYGAIVEVVDQSGFPLEASPLLCGRGPFWECEDPIADPILSYTPALSLGSIPLGDAPLDGRIRRLLLFAADGKEQRLGPITFEVEIPGYQPVWTELWAEAASQGVPEVRVPTKRLTNGWSSLRVAWDRPLASAELESLPMRRPIGLLHLFEEDTRTALSMAMDSSLEEATFDRVPRGRYQVRFKASDWSYEDPPPGERIELVLGSGTNSLVLHREGTGSLRVFLQDESGNEYTGSALFQVRSVRRGTHSYVSFQGAPYLICFLEPGPYSVSLASMGGVHLEQRGSDEIDVLPDDVAFWEPRTP